MISALARRQEQLRFGLGQSKAAARRRQESAAARGKIHNGRPGEIFRIGAQEYQVAPDGSFHRLTFRPGEERRLERKAA